MDLDTLIRTHDLEITSEALDGLLHGVCAAPRGEYPHRWMDLVSTNRSDELTAALAQVLQLVNESLDDGLGVAPAPAERLAGLREALQTLGVDGFLIPRGDEFRNEYPPRRADRLEWLTGFSGSAGLCAVLTDGRAAIFVDGRYTLQAREQVDASAFENRHSEKQPLDEWLTESLRSGERLGVDPWLHSSKELAKLEEACARCGAQLVRLEENPVDRIWASQPAAPVAPLRVHPIEFAGLDASAKRRLVLDEQAKRGAGAAVFTATDSVAWLTNLRGGDLPHTPAFLGAVILTENEMTLFVDRRKLTTEVEAHLADTAVRDLSEFRAALRSLGDTGAQVIVDESTSPAAVIDLLTEGGATPVLGTDPVTLPKAKKNEAELRGTRAAHRRDGAAVSQFLHWLESAASTGQLGELAAAEALLQQRRAQERFEDLSFETITGAGPNGAIIHYRATPKSERHLLADSLYLVDSGAQYQDGTTDITRTVALGDPSEEHRDRFTRVLKGHIAIARVVFPQGTTGSQIDVLARRSLWEAGLDYDHGTGHGVGSYLSVHEGPQRIANRPNTVPLELGMVCSNEPGYYKEGAFGIRIENLVVVVPAPEIAGSERTMYGFETLTLAPIDRRLVNSSMLTKDELRWLNAYHARVCESLAPIVDHETAKWLRRVTEPIV